MQRALAGAAVVAALLSSIVCGQASGPAAGQGWQLLEPSSPGHFEGIPLDPAPPRSALLEAAAGDDLRLRFTATCSLPASRFCFLYRTPATLEGEVSASLVFASADTVAHSLLPCSMRWRVAELTAAAPWPTGDWSLRLSAPGEGTVVQLLLPADPAASWSPEQALRDLAAAYATQGKAQDQRTALESLAELLTRTGEAALALRDCGDILAASGDPTNAVRAYLRALAEQDSRPGTWGTFPGGGYAQNRLAVDFASQARAKLAGVAGGCPPEVASAAYRAAAMKYPLTPTAKAAAVAYAKATSAGGRPSDAAPWLLLALDQGGDHDPVKATLRLPENQAHLDAISKPTDRAVLADALGLLLSASGESLSPELRAQTADAWLLGEEAGLRRDQPGVSAAFTQAAAAADGTVLALCARIALSQWLQCLGYFIEAEDAALGRVAQAVEGLVGGQEAGRLWGEAADAQLAAGHRHGAARFTRFALDAAHLGEASPEDRVTALRAAIERLQTGYQYHVSISGGATAQWDKWPVDEAYSEELAGELIEAACKGRTTMAAGGDLLPLARDLAGNAWKALPARLFEAVGLGSLASTDLVRYAKCTEDHRARMEALKLAWSAGGTDPVFGRDGLRMSLMRECTAAGDYDGAEALMTEMLADPSASAFTKANAAYSLGWCLHLQKQDDRSKHWLTLVVTEFPDTTFGELAAKCLATQFEPPQAEKGE